jgi:hypothetical protein
MAETYIRIATQPSEVDLSLTHEINDFTVVAALYKHYRAFQSLLKPFPPPCQEADLIVQKHRSEPDAQR